MDDAAPADTADGSRSASLDLSALPAGSYLVTLTLGNASTTRKLVLQ